MILAKVTVAAVLRNEETTKMKISTAVMLAALSISMACSQSIPSDGSPQDPAPGGSNGTNQPVASTQEGDWAAIEKLEGEAKSIASANGCSGSGECRTAPVGSRGCGGPRYYITYCSKTTDSAALFRKLDQVAAAERAYNTKYKIASTCEFRMPPVVTLNGGACTAQ